MMLIFNAGNALSGWLFAPGREGVLAGRSAKLHFAPSNEPRQEERSATSGSAGPAGEIEARWGAAPAKPTIKGRRGSGAGAESRERLRGGSLQEASVVSGGLRAASARGIVDLAGAAPHRFDSGLRAMHHNAFKPGGH